MWGLYVKLHMYCGWIVRDDGGTMQTRTVQLRGMWGKKEKKFAPSTLAVDLAVMCAAYVVYL